MAWKTKIFLCENVHNSSLVYLRQTNWASLHHIRIDSKRKRPTFDQSLNGKGMISNNDVIMICNNDVMMISNNDVMMTSNVILQYYLIFSDMFHNFPFSNIF